MADDGNPDKRQPDSTGESEEGGGDTIIRSSSNSALADGLSSLISSVMTTFDSRAEATTRSQDQLASSLDRLTGELDKLLEDAPSPFIMQHAARISGVRKRVKSLNSVLKSVQRRIDNMDRILSAGLAHVPCLQYIADDSLLYIGLSWRASHFASQLFSLFQMTNYLHTYLASFPILRMNSAWVQKQWREKAASNSTLNDKGI